MARVAFELTDLLSECQVQESCYRLDGRALGLKIFVPQALQNQYPFNASAYAFLQQLRTAIWEYGTIEFPDLPVNKINHTLCQRAPKQHRYSTNPYMTGSCQHLHQDTPPYPTAFWLGHSRHYYATWVTSVQGEDRYFDYLDKALAEGAQTAFDGEQLDEVHRFLVAESLANGSGLLLNQQPGLLLINNSQRHRLYHARTCQFAAVSRNPDYLSDTPMYAYNEQGLLNYIDQLDSRRGSEDRCSEDLQQVKAYLAAEARLGRIN